VRRKLKNLKNKSGDSQNGAPRTLIDLAVYYEHRSAVDPLSTAPRFDSEYSGWSNPSRPRDQAITLRRHFSMQR
jgi:hypothetical protein